MHDRGSLFFRRFLFSNLADFIRKRSASKVTSMPVRPITQTTAYCCNFHLRMIKTPSASKRNLFWDQSNPIKKQFNIYSRCGFRIGYTYRIELSDK